MVVIFSYNDQKPNHMKLLKVVTVLAMLSLFSCTQGPQYITIDTEYGTMVAELYDSTPLHRDNMVKLAKSCYYDDLLFHRVIQGFMIQGGDPNSRNAKANQQLGSGGPGYLIDAEIGAPHFKGALAAARTGGPQNPDKKSSGSQFYIVQGKKIMTPELDMYEKQHGIKYNETQRKKYQEVGGTPMLDTEYTVFGELVSGLDVIDKIAAQQTGAANRPVSDIKMKIRLGK